MKHLFIFINLWRLWPHMVMYLVNKSIIQKDLKRMNYVYNVKSENLIYALLYVLVWNVPFRNVFYYRYKRNSILCLIGKLLLKPMGSLEIGGDINEGLVIYHGNGSVIQPQKIGNNCSIWQQVTIGRKPKKNSNIDKPTIGNNVCIYAGAIVLGDIRIGNNAEIGAGAVCIKDVPDNAIVVGNPAKIVKIKGDEN